MNPMAWSIRLFSRSVWNEETEKWCQLSECEDTIFDNQRVITLVLDHSLPKPKRISFIHKDGSPWSHHQFVDAIIEAYRALVEKRVLSEDTFNKLVLDNAEKKSRTWYLDISS